MGAAIAWFTTVMILLGGMLALNHLGVDVSSLLTAAVSGVFHSLGQPILTP